MSTTTLFLILLMTMSVLAASTLPSVERSAAVFTGRVPSTEKVKVQSDKFWKWEICRAEVKLHSVTKQDTNFSGSVFVYYEQDHDDADDAKNTLFIPEGGWLTAP